MQRWSSKSDHSRGMGARRMVVEVLLFVSVVLDIDDKGDKKILNDRHFGRPFAQAMASSMSFSIASSNTTPMRGSICSRP